MNKSNLVTRIYRLTRIIIHTIVGLVIAACVFPIVQKPCKLSLTKWWCGGLLRAFGIKVRLFGDVPQHDLKGILYVANHVSWSDIHALNSVISLRFVAKSDIKDWPIFGYLVTKANTLFIDRSKRHEAAKIVDLVAQSLLQHDNLCFFPEGTTTDGTHMMPFKSSVLQAAINANTQVWPIAIRYVNSDGSINIDMAYAGDTTLIDSMKTVINIKAPVVELHFLTPINAQQQNRRDLTQLAFEAIKLKLAL